MSMPVDGTRATLPGLEVGDDAIGQRRERRRGVLEGHRALGEQLLDAVAIVGVGPAREPRAHLRGAPRGDGVDGPDRLEAPAAVVLRAAWLLPGQQTRGVARGVDDDGPLVPQSVVGLDRELDRTAVPRMAHA